MTLDRYNKDIESHEKPWRIGRGLGSGNGKTAGSGHKGQASRSGWSQPSVFQGGMSPLVRRIPKRGFNNAYGADVGVVNVGELELVFNAGDEVNGETLKKTNLLKGMYDEIKILGDGELTKKLVVKAHRFSASAKAKIEKAGGKCEVIPARTLVEVKKKAAAEKKKSGAKAGAAKAKKK